MDINYSDIFNKKENPDTEKPPPEIDYSSMFSLDGGNGDGDSQVREWLKSFYTGKQKIDDIEITPELKRRYVRYLTAPGNKPEDVDTKLAATEKIAGSAPVQFLGDLGAGTMKGLAGAVRGADWLSGLMNVRPQLPPELEAKRESWVKDIADLLAKQSTKSSEMGFAEGSIPKYLAQGLGHAAVSVPIMSAAGIVPYSMATGGGEAAHEGKSGFGQFANAAYSGAVGLVQDRILHGIGKRELSMIPRQLLGGAAMAGVPIVSETAMKIQQGKDPTDIDWKKVIADFIQGVLFPLGSKKKSPTYKDRAAELAELQKQAEIEFAEQKPIKLERPGPTVPSEKPTMKDTAPIEKSAPGASSQEKLVEKSVEKPVSANAEKLVAGETKDIAHGGVNEGKVGIEVLKRAPEVVVNKDGSTTTGKLGDEGVVKVYENGGTAYRRIAGREDAWESFGKGPSREVTDQGLIDKLNAAGPSRRYVEQPEVEISGTAGFSAEERAALGIKDIPAATGELKTKPRGSLLKTEDNINNEYITVYHRTNADPKEFSGGFKSKENTGEIFVSNKRDGAASDYGKNVIELRVKKSDLRLDDEFPNGEEHYAIPAKLASKYFADMAPQKPAAMEAQKFEATKDITPPDSLPPQEAPAPSGMLGGKIKAGLDSISVKHKHAKNAYLDWVSRVQGADNLTRFADDNGIKLDDALNPMLAIRKKWGSVGTANSILSDGTFKYDNNGNIVRTGDGLVKILDDYDAGSAIKDPRFIGKKKTRAERNKNLDEFLQANRIVTDLAGTDKLKPGQLDAAQKKLLEMQRSNPQEFENMTRAAERIYDFQRRVLNMLSESGIISKEYYNELSENKAYVPFERIFPDKPKAGVVGGKNRSTPRKVLFKMRGSELGIHNTVESIVKKTYEIVDAANTNYVNRSIAQFEKLLPGLVERVKAPAKPITVSAQETGLPNDVVVFRRTRFQAGENEMVVYENGKPTTYKLSGGLEKAITVLDPKSVGLFTKILSIPTRILKVGATSTPEFALRNFMRDQTGAMINTKIKFRPFVDSVSAVADIMGKNDIFKEYMASGAGMQSYGELNRAALQKTLNHLRGHRSVLEKMNIIQRIGDFSSLLETATRVGVYKRARQQGLSAPKAATISAESTLDFRRSGARGERVNKTIAFFNAGIQGTDRMARAAKANPVGFTAKAIATVTIPEVIFQILNKDDEEFKNSPRWRKDLFWHIPGLNAWIPKPFIVGQAFGSVPGRFMEYALTKDQHAFDNIINTLLEGFSPVGMDAIGGLIPTGLRPLLENIMNYNFFTQTNLYPEYKEKLLPEERSSKYTAETWKMLGGLLNAAPSDLENVWRGYTGTLGKYFEQGSDALIKSIKSESGGGRPTELSDVPIVRGFVGRRASAFPEKLNQFYRAYEDIDSAYSQYKNYERSGKSEKAREFLKDNPHIKYRGEFERYRNKMSELGKRIDNVNNSSLPDERKRALAIDIEKQRLDYLDRILKLYSGKLSLVETPKAIKKIYQ